MLWLLDFILPDWSIHLLLVAGIVVLLISKFVPLTPQLIPYKAIITIAAWVVLGYAMFMEGSIWKDDIWADRIKDAQLKVAEAERKAAEANSKIEYIYVEKKVLIKDNKAAALANVQANAAEMNKYCSVIPEVINILNASASNQAGGKK